MSTKFVNSNNLETLARGLYDRVDTRLDGKSFKYLTLAKYEALSDAEKAREDIIYQITDAELSYNDLADKPDLSVYATTDYVDGHVFSGDYNDLTNKPCYDNRKISTKTVRFDGNIDQNELVDIDIFNCLKISDDIIHMDELIGKSITLDSGDSQVITEEMVSDLINNLESGSGCLIEDLFMFFLYEESVFKYSNGTVLPAGVWMANLEDWTYGGFTLTCDVTEGELKQLDEKFIPDTIARVDNISFDDLKNKPFYDGREYILSYNGNRDEYESMTFDSVPLLKLSDKVILRDDILSVTSDGVDNVEYNIADLANNSNTISGSAYAFLTTEYIIYFIEEDWSARDDSSNIVTIPAGIWLALLDVSSGSPVFVNNVPSFRFKFTLSSGDIKQLDEKFIPDTIARKSDVPNITIITQADYDALEAAGEEDPDTFYLISDEL